MIFKKSFGFYFVDVFSESPTFLLRGLLKQGHRSFAEKTLKAILRQAEEASTWPKHMCFVWKRVWRGKCLTQNGELCMYMHVFFKNVMVWICVVHASDSLCFWNVLTSSTNNFFQLGVFWVRGCNLIGFWFRFTVDAHLGVKLWESEEFSALNGWASNVLEMRIPLNTYTAYTMNRYKQVHLLFLF